MNENEIINNYLLDEFVKSVKGQKIRLPYWGDKWYFIPDGTRNGDEFYGIDEKGRKAVWMIDDWVTADD